MSGSRRAVVEGGMWGEGGGLSEQVRCKSQITECPLQRSFGGAPLGPEKTTVTRKIRPAGDIKPYLVLHCLNYLVEKPIILPWRSAQEKKENREIQK